MAVTIQQIAQEAGVSRGTVDRALNHRGRINPEVAVRIQKIADDLGYIPKHRQKKENKKIKLGVVTQLAKSSFMLEIKRGILQAKEELKDWGIEVVLREVYSVNEQEQLNAIDALMEEEINALALMPVDCERVREKINWLVMEKEIPVVTFNSDIVGTKRSCFVGMDNYKSGRTAAGLMGMLTGGKGKILVITGFFSNPVNNARVEGFVEEIKNNYPDLELAGVHGSFDNSDEVEKIIKNTMLSVTGINGVFVVSGGQDGIRRAYSELHLEKRPYTIIYDLTPKNCVVLKDDIADFLIDQEGYLQGYEPLYILAGMLVKNQMPEQEYRYTDIAIKTKYNI